MGRKSKDPEIRRMELILAAEALFKEKGFDATAVSDITDRIGVSHGAFFYYFKAKNEMLKAVIDYELGLERDLIMGIVKNDTLDALKKIQALLDMTCISGEKPENGEDKLAEYLNKEGNEALHGEYVRRSQKVVIPLVTEIVEQGVREGVFDVKYPKETVEYMVYLLNDIQHDLRKVSQSNDVYYRKVRAIETILIRVFGAKDGSISLLS